MPAYPKLPAILLRNPSRHSLARRLPPDSACVKALPLALALPLHLCWGPGARTFRLAASAGIFLGKWNSFLIRRRGRGVSSRLIHGETSASWCQAKCPGSRALAMEYEETGGGQVIALIIRSLFVAGFSLLVSVSPTIPLQKGSDNEGVDNFHPSC